MGRVSMDRHSRTAGLMIGASVAAMLACSSASAEVPLFAVSGDGATTSESLFAVSTTDATSIFLAGLGNGDDGEVIVYSPPDDLIFHFSGRGTANDDSIFEGIDPTTFDIVPIGYDGGGLTPSGVGFAEEALAGAFESSSGTILVADLNGEFYRVTTDGVVSHLGTLGFETKGLAFADGKLLAIEQFDSFTGDDELQLVEIDPADGSTISSVTVTLDGRDLNGQSNGLATDPATGEVYAIVREGGTRILVTIDPETGVATEIGELDEKFAGITFIGDFLFESDNIFDQQQALTPLFSNHHGAALSSGVQTVVVGRLGEPGATEQVGSTGLVQFASLSPSAHARPGEDSTQLAEASGAADVKSRFGVWIKGQGTGYDGNDTAFDGSAFDLMGGVDYKIGSRALIGVLAGYGAMSLDTSVNGSDGQFDANGISAGLYGGIAVTPNIFLDGLVAYTRTDYDNDSGATTSSYEGNRVTVAANVTGRFGFKGVLIEPTAGIVYARESQDAYTDSAGVSHGSESISAGRVSIGPKVIVPVELTNARLMPWVAAKAEYDFSNQEDIANTSLPDLDGEFSVRVSGGVEGRIGKRVYVGVRGDISGIGSDEYLGYGGALTVRFTF